MNVVVYAIAAVSALLILAGLRGSLRYENTQKGTGHDLATPVDEIGASRGESASGDAAGGTFASPCSPRPTVPTPMGVSWKAPVSWPASWAVPAAAWTTAAIDDAAGFTLNADRSWKATPKRPIPAPWRPRPVPAAELVAAGEWPAPSAFLPYMPTGARGAA